MPTSLHGGEVSIKSYLIGAVLALVLTAIPFGLVATRALRPIQIFVVIGVAAITQVVVHLRYFLHIDLKPSSQNKLIALCFAALVFLVLVGGTLWIVFDRNYRIM
jgi:cytochrome o ubiquinol oxidase subunit IV